MAHPFFLSYARKDSRINNDPGRPDPHFETFLSRLNMRVDQLTGATGFVDRSEIKSGQDWTDEIAEGVRTSETLVCLYSPSYFLSDYCGKEMQVLLDRRKHYLLRNGGKKPANIIPVLWHPIPGRIPRTLPEIQYEAPDLDPKTKGAWNLGDGGRTRELEEFADQIALRVRDAADETPLPGLDRRPMMGAVRSAFLPPPLPPPEFDSPEARAGPSVVTFVYPSGPQWSNWPWAPPAERAALHLSAAVAKGKEIEVNQLAFDPSDPGLVIRLDAARQRNNIVVVLVDADSLTTDALCTRMREYDQRQYSQFATVVIWSGNRQPESERKVNEIFAYCSRRTPPYYHCVEDRNQLGDALSQTLASLQLAIMNDPHKPKSIREPTAFPSLPTVTGPGRPQSE